MIYINISLSAPIIILEDAQLGSLKFNLGCCELQTPKACSIRDFILDVDLRETQLRYNNSPMSLNDTDSIDNYDNLWSSEDKIAINPIPVHIQFSTKRLKELVIQARIEHMLFKIDGVLLGLFRAFQKSLYRELSSAGKKNSTMRRTDPILTPIQGEASPRLLIPPESDALRDERIKLEMASSANKVTLESLIIKVSVEQISVTCMSVNPTTADLRLAAMGLTTDFQLFRSGERLLTVVTGFLSLEDLQRNISIFTTLTKTSSDMNESLQSRNPISKHASFRDTIETPFDHSSLEQAFKMLLWQPGMNRLNPEAIHTSSFSKNPEVQLNPDIFVSVSTSPMEAQWHKDSIHDILVTLESYKGKDIEDDDTTRSGESTEAANEPDENGDPSISGDERASRGVKLDISEELPQFVHQSVESSPKDVLRVIQFSSKGIAISFLETNGKTLCRMGLQDLEVDYIVVNEFKEAEMQLSIGWGEVTVLDRCVLAPKADSNLFREDTGDGNEKVEDLYSENRKLLTATYRSYDWATGELSYSSCMKACVASVTYVYYQQDLSKVIRYLSGSILETIFWRSYEVAKSLAKESHFLFAVTIEKPQFILSEDKSAIPQMYYKDLFSHKTAVNLYGTYSNSVSPSITSSEALIDKADTTSEQQGKPFLPSAQANFDISTFRGGFRSDEIFQRYAHATHEDVEAVLDELRGVVKRQKSALEIAVTRRVVDKFYLGTYLELTLGTFDVHNQYSLASTGETESNMIFDLNGLSIGSVSTPFGSYPTEVMHSGH